MDVYGLAGDAGPPRPAVLVIHGGGWNAGDKSQMGTQSARLAQEGYIVANTNYRLVGPTAGVVFPEPLQDVWCALAFLRAQASAFNLDPTRVAVLGYSAGAYFAEMVGLNPASVRQSLQCPSGSTVAPAAVVAGAGPSDLLTLCSSIKNSVGGCDTLLDELLGADGGPLYAQASPLFNVMPGLPPFLLVQGTADIYVGEDDSVNMAQALEDAGDPASLLLLNGDGHTWNPGADLGTLDTIEYAIDTPAGWAAVLQFLAATVGPS
jgi:acetyl esterase/lipase